MLKFFKDDRILYRFHLEIRFDTNKKKSYNRSSLKIILVNLIYCFNNLNDFELPLIETLTI